MYGLAPVACCPCDPCTTCNASLTIGAGEDVLMGDVLPEGAQTASPGQMYRFNDGVSYEVWFKETGTNTPYGWVLWFTVI